jgi:Tfp pilus assembly protein PilX
MNYELRITNRKNKQGGYAILFTLVIIMIIITFAFGMSNNSLKRMILSSTANDSQIAFYQADTAGECALYILTHSLITSSSFSCGKDLNGNSISLTISVDPNNSSIIKIKPNTSDPNEPCFNIVVDQTQTPKTIVKALGYNVCESSNPRQVERAIKITY